MSFSPTNILQRLPELRLWQNNTEELLKRIRNSNANNLTSASDYQSIDGLSAFDSSSNHENSFRNLESRIISPTKTFNQLLEEKLSEDVEPPKSVVERPRRPFLRKGTGLQRFRMTPDATNNKNKKIVRRRKVTNKKSPSSESDITPLRAPDLVIKPKATWTRVNAEDNIRKINELAQTSTNLQAGPSEQTLYEKALEKELLIFEALEDKAENSSFCSTNSSVLRILSSTPSKRVKGVEKQETITEEKRVHWESPSDQSSDVIESNLEKSDIKKILFNLQRLTEENQKIRAENLESPVEFSDEDKWSTTDDSSSTTSISSTDLETTLKTDKKDVAVGTNNVESESEAEQFCVNCESLRQQIDEFQDKIKNLLKDKNRVLELKNDLQHKKDVSERNFAKAKKELEEENGNLLLELEGEKKKLQKEKQVFQTYIKDSQNRPTRKEREETSNLKQEIADLRETLKLKESKTGMTQARLRNQIKQLEKENSNLKDEVEKLTRDNAKLSAAQKISRRPSETKILHEINKNITKLTEEALKKQNVIQGDAKKDTSKKSVGENLTGDYDSFLEMANMTNFRNTDFVDVEKEYESVFRRECRQNQTLNDTKKNERTEKMLEDGGKETKYSNGNVKTVSADGNFITMKYYNGDIKQTYLLDGMVKYFYSDKNIWQTTFSDGSENIEFPDGSQEKRSKDGKLEITLSDGILQTIHPDGTQEVKYTDGSTLKVLDNGDKVLLLPNGQKEIETREHKRREYPDGTVKILFPDGSQETRYANGRIRIKGKNGELLVDTHS